MKLNSNVYITVFVRNFGPAEQCGRTILFSFIRAVIKYNPHIWVGRQAVIVIHVWLWVIVYNVTPVDARQGLWCFTLKWMWIRKRKHLNLIAKVINAYRPTLQWYAVDDWLKCIFKNNEYGLNWTNSSSHNADILQSKPLLPQCRPAPFWPSVQEAIALPITAMYMKFA